MIISQVPVDPHMLVLLLAVIIAITVFLLLCRLSVGDQPLPRLL